jgi:hypothetical protein
MPNHEALMSLPRACLATEFRWPLVAHVRRELHSLGHGRLEPLEDALDGLLVVDFGHHDDSRVRLTVEGLFTIDRGARELRNFVSVLRRCYDAYYSHLGSPAQPESVVVSSTELLPGLTEVERAKAATVVGLLFEVEGIGSLEGSLEPGEPFQIILDSSFLFYGRVGVIKDYLEIKHGHANSSPNA